MNATWEIAAVVSKVLSLMAVAGVIGGVFSSYLGQSLNPQTRKRVRSYTAISACLGILSVSLFFLTQIGGINQQGLSGVFDYEMGEILAQSSVGASSGLRLVGFLLVIAAYFVQATAPKIGEFAIWRKLIVLVALAAAFSALAYSFTLTGHVTELTAIARFAIVFHILAVFLWIGSLLPLQIYCTQARTDARQVQKLMETFGKTAVYIVATLVISGIYVLSQLLESWSELLTTSYGNTMLVKLGGVTLLLSLAVLNKLLLVPGLSTGNGRALAASIKLETLLAVCILAVTSYLTIVIGI